MCFLVVQTAVRRREDKKLPLKSHPDLFVAALLLPSETFLQSKMTREYLCWIYHKNTRACAKIVCLALETETT